LHRQQPEKDKQNVDVAASGKISADAHAREDGLFFLIPKRARARRNISYLPIGDCLVLVHIHPNYFQAAL